MAQFNIKPDALKEFEAARDQILIELANEHPQGVRYTWCAIPGSNSFIGWLELDEGVENPLPNMNSGKEFMKSLQSWIATPPAREELHFVASYPPAK
jgi:hypothetical protein